MPRYDFDVIDSDGLHRDDFGEDCAECEEGRQHAQSLLPDIAREELPDGDLHTVGCDVRVEAGCIVCRGEITYRGTRDPARGRLGGIWAAENRNRPTTPAILRLLGRRGLRQ